MSISIECSAFLIISVNAVPDMWQKILKQLKLDPEEFIYDYEEKIVDTLVKNFKATPVSKPLM